jgi:hypothetical protein
MKKCNLKRNIFPFNELPYEIILLILNLLSRNDIISLMKASIYIYLLMKNESRRLLNNYMKFDNFSYSLDCLLKMPYRELSKIIRNYENVRVLLDKTNDFWYKKTLVDNLPLCSRSFTLSDYQQRWFNREIVKSEYNEFIDFTNIDFKSINMSFLTCCNLDFTNSTFTSVKITNGFSTKFLFHNNVFILCNLEDFDNNYEITNNLKTRYCQFLNDWNKINIRELQLPTPLKSLYLGNSPEMNLYNDFNHNYYIKHQLLDSKLNSDDYITKELQKSKRQMRREQNKNNRKNYKGRNFNNVK